MDMDVAHDRAKKILGFFVLNDFADELIEGYPHGMKQKLIISDALIHNPKVLIVDEPLVGLDPKGARQVKKLFQDLCAEGTTIFFVNTFARCCRDHVSSSEHHSKRQNSRDGKGRPIARPVAT